MKDVEKGKHILSIAKSLKVYQSGDVKIAAFLYASSLAGRAGLFASALRHWSNVQLGRLTMLGAEEGLGYPDLVNTVLPWLEDAGLARIKRLPAGEIRSVESLVLTYDSILTAVSRLYESLKPMPQDRGCIYIVDMASKMPQLESDIMQAVVTTIGEEEARVALDLAKGYKLVAYREGGGLREPILYSERLWARSMDRAARALTSLDNTDRALMVEMIGQVKGYQGMPEALLQKFASDNNATHVLQLAVGVGLLR